MQPPTHAENPSEPRPEPPPQNDRRFIDVTVALAQGGYIFSMYSNDRLGVFWELLFNVAEGPQASIEIQAHGDWVSLVGGPSLGKPDDQLARALLKLNGRVATARAGFNSNGEVIVVTNFHRDLLSMLALRHHITTVLETIVDIRQLIAKGTNEADVSS
jgi:hypothetical protein